MLLPAPWLPACRGAGGPVRGGSTARIARPQDIDLQNQGGDWQQHCSVVRPLGTSAFARCAALPAVDEERLNSHAQASTSTHSVAFPRQRHSQRQPQQQQKKQQHHQQQQGHLVAVAPDAVPLAWRQTDSSPDQASQGWMPDLEHRASGGPVDEHVHSRVAQQRHAVTWPVAAQHAQGSTGTSGSWTAQPPSSLGVSNGRTAVHANVCHRPHESGVTPFKLAALSSALNMPVAQLQQQLPKHPRLLVVPASDLAHAHKALREGLGLRRRVARLMLMRHPQAAVQLTAHELLTRAAQLASMLGPGAALSAQHVLRAVGRGAPSLLIRQPSIVAARLKRLAAALAPGAASSGGAATAGQVPGGGGSAAGLPSVLPVAAVLEMVGRAPELLSKPPAAVARRLEQCLAVLQGRWQVVGASSGGSSISHVLAPHSTSPTAPAAAPPTAARAAPAAAGPAPVPGIVAGHGGWGGAGTGTGRSRQQPGDAAACAASVVEAAGRAAAVAAAGPHVAGLQALHMQPSRASVLRALRRRPDLLLISPRVLRNKLAALQCVLDRPRRLAVPLLLACPALARHSLDAARAAYEVLQPITGRDQGFTFGMVCHAPRLLLAHPQALASQALRVRQAVRQVEAWRRELQRCSPAHAADLLGRTAPTYARLAYLVYTQQAHTISLHAALCMPRCDFLARFPHAASTLLMAVAVKKRPLSRIPRWSKRRQQQQQEAQRQAVHEGGGGPASSPAKCAKGMAAGSGRRHGGRTARRRVLALAPQQQQPEPEPHSLQRQGQSGPQQVPCEAQVQEQQEVWLAGVQSPLVLFPSTSMQPSALVNEGGAGQQQQQPLQSVSQAFPGQAQRHQQEVMLPGSLVAAEQQLCQQQRQPGRRRQRQQDQPANELLQQHLQPAAPALVLHPAAATTTQGEVPAAFGPSMPQQRHAVAAVGNGHLVTPSLLRAAGQSVALAAQPVTEPLAGQEGHMPTLHHARSGEERDEGEPGLWQHAGSEAEAGVEQQGEERREVLGHSVQLSAPSHPGTPAPRGRAVQVVRLGGPAPGTPATAALALGAFGLHQAQAGVTAWAAGGGSGTVRQRGPTGTRSVQAPGSSSTTG